MQAGLRKAAAAIALGYLRLLVIGTAGVRSATTS